MTDLMNKLTNKLRNGLNDWELLILATFCMTMYTLANYGDRRVFIVYHSAMQLRLLGSLAVPLFTFVLVNKLRRTSNRKRFAKRLYLAAMLVGFGVMALNWLFAKAGLYYDLNAFCNGNNNYLFTFFYMVIYILLLDKLFKSRSWSIKLVAFLGIVAISIVPDRLWHFVDQTKFFHGLLDSSDFQGIAVWRDLLHLCFPNPLHAEGGLLLILLGVLLYYARDKKWQAAICAGFYLFWMLLAMNISFFHLRDLDFFLGSTIPSASLYIRFDQVYTAWAALPMLLYNGQPGRQWKWFFYAYYPLHYYLVGLFVLLMVGPFVIGQ